MAAEILNEVTYQNIKLPPMYDANDLTKDGNLAQIKLFEQIYTLRITRAGRLILTK